MANPFLASAARSGGHNEISLDRGNVNGRTDNCGPLQFDHRDGCAIENIFLALPSSTGSPTAVLVSSLRAESTYDPPFISRGRRIRLVPFSPAAVPRKDIMYPYIINRSSLKLDRSSVRCDGCYKATFSRHLLTRRNLYTSRPIYDRLGPDRQNISARLINYRARVYVLRT